MYSSNGTKNIHITPKPFLLPKKCQIQWDKTPNFLKNGSVTADINHITGESVYGVNRGKNSTAKNNVLCFLEQASRMDVFLRVEKGRIIKSPPTKEQLIDKLVATGNHAVKYYGNVPYELLKVRDHWAEDAIVHEGDPLNKSNQLQGRVLQRRGKRFSAKNMTVKEKVIDILKHSCGMLAEGHVIAFLNSGLKCPECKSIGQIGWCNGITGRSVDGFRDAVCMSCYKKDIVTLFEIKTRWEKSVQKSPYNTYAGSFVSLNSLMTIKANVYMVIASRDTGDVRIGKITSAKMRGNASWLYALQEGYTWGGPSSYITCSGGFQSCPVKMTPLLDILPDNLFESILNSALKKIAF